MIDGFDPARTGPIELANRLARWLSINIFRVLGVGLAGLVLTGIGVERGWFSIPSIPTAVWVLVFGALGGAVLGIYPMHRTITAIWDDSTVRLVELDPASGDLSVWSISEERFSDLAVIDHKGNQHDPSTFLNDIRLGSGELGYEVDAYSPEDNVAVSSWMAGVRNREIRRHERAIDYVKRELSVEADKTLDQLINSGDVLRQQGKAVGMHLIKAVEGVQTPDSGDTRLHEDMFTALDDHDETAELISGTGARDPERAIREFVEDEVDVDEGSGSDEDESDGGGVEPARSEGSLAIELTRNGHGGGGESS